MNNNTHNINGPIVEYVQDEFHSITSQLLEKSLADLEELRQHLNETNSLVRKAEKIGATIHWQEVGDAEDKIYLYDGISIDGFRFPAVEGLEEDLDFFYRVLSMIEKDGGKLFE